MNDPDDRKPPTPAPAQAGLEEATSPCSAETASEEIDKTVDAAAPLPPPREEKEALSPVDLPPPPHPLPDALRWTSTVIVVACVVLALFNAGSIKSWSYELTPGPVSQRVVAAAEWWDGVTAAVGLNRPVDTLRNQWKGVQDARFGNEAGEAAE